MHKPTYIVGKSWKRIEDWTPIDNNIKRPSSLPIKTNSTLPSILLDVEALEKEGARVEKGCSRTRAISNLTRNEYRFGFDKIEFQPIQPREDSALPRAELKGVYLRWLHSYQAEARDFASLGVWAECVWRQMETATTYLVTPNPLTVGTACMLLEKLAPTLANFGDMILVIRSELLSALYLDYECSNRLDADWADPFNLGDTLEELRRTPDDKHKQTVKPNLQQLLADTVESSPHPKLRGERATADFRHLSHPRWREHAATSKDLIDMVLYAEIHENYRLRYHREKESVKKFEKNVKMQVKALQVATIIYEKEVLRILFNCWRRFRNDFSMHSRLSKHVMSKRNKILRQLCFIHWRMVVGREKFLFFPEVTIQQKEDLANRTEREISALNDQLMANNQRTKELLELIQQRENRKFQILTQKQYWDLAKRKRELVERCKSYEEQIDEVTKVTNDALGAHKKEVSYFNRLDPWLFDYLRKLSYYEDTYCLGARGNPIQFMQLLQRFKFERQGAFLPYMKERIHYDILRRETHTQMLIFWINEVIKNQSTYKKYNRLVENFDVDMEDGMHFCYILHALFPAVCQFNIDDPKTVQVRVALLFQALKELDIPLTLHHTDINRANERLLVMIWSLIHQKWTYYHKLDYVDRVTRSTFQEQYSHLTDRTGKCLEHLQETYQDISDSNYNWDTITDHISQQSMGDMLTQCRRTTMEEPYNPQFNKDVNLYTHPKVDRIMDLLPSQTEHMQPALLQLKKVLQRNFKFMKGMFQFYSALPSQHQPGFGMAEFNKFILDIRLLPSKQGITKGQLDVVMTKVTFKDQHTDKQADKPDHNRLNPRGFVELLIRLANTRYRDDSNPTVASKLNALMVDHCLPHAGVTDSDDLKAKAIEPMMQQVLKRYHKQLAKIFAFYAADDLYDPNAAACNVREFATMWKDGEFIDKNFTRNDILCLFNSSQDNSEHYNEDSEMDFNEFFTSLVTMSLWKNPNPFISDAIRVDRFLSEQFIPGILKRQPQLRVEQKTPQGVIGGHAAVLDRPGSSQ